MHWGYTGTLAVSHSQDGELAINSRIQLALHLLGLAGIAGTFGLVDLDMNPPCAARLHVFDVVPIPMLVRGGAAINDMAQLIERTVILREAGPHPTKGIGAD